MNFHQTVNSLEAALWAIIGVGFAWRGIQSNDPKARIRCRIAAAAFLLFGLSDVIEISTGAWWRPWWLLALKAVCVLALAGLYVAYRRDVRNGATDQAAEN